MLSDCAVEVDVEFADLRSAIDGIRLSQNEKRTCIVHVQSAEEVQQLKWLSENFVGRPILAIVSGQCPSEMIFAVSKAGASQILPRPFGLEDLRESLENLKKRHAIPEAVCARRVIAISGVAGGCGATTLAINLAYEIGHLLNLSCILMELATNMGMATTFLDVTPRQTINDLLCDMRSVDVELVARRLTKITDNLRLLPAAYQDHDRLSFSAHDLITLIHYTKQLADVVVLDAPGSNYSANVETYAFADQLVLVAEQSVPSLRALSFMREKLEKDGIAKPQLLVINRYNPSRKEFLVTHLQRLLQTPQLATVANDYVAVSGALNEGRPLRVHAPHSNVLADIDQLVRLLLAPSEPEEPPKPKRPSLLGRMVRALVGL